MPESQEQIDITNIIEIQKIRELLINYPDLLSMFEIIIIMCNKKINEEEEKRSILL